MGDWLAASGQARKVYTDTLNREWNLLTNLECYFGHQISKGGQAAAAVRKLVEDARPLEHLHQDTFTQGSTRCRDHGGSYEYCVSTGMEVCQNAEEKQARHEQSKIKKQRQASGLDSLFGV